MKKIFLIRLVLVVFVQLLFINCSVAQSSKKLIHEGNKKYEEKKFSDAEINYRKSLNTKDNQFIGNYNLGNTLYQQGKFDEAKQQYENAAGFRPDKEQLSKTLHNLGNTYVKNKKFEEGIQAYKQALKLNPKDNDTRYNLAYAKAMMQQQQQQNQDKKQDNKDQDKKDKQEKEKEQQQKQQEQKQDQAKEEQKKEQQVKKDKISKEDAEKILLALNNDEKKIQKKLNVKEPTKIVVEKEC